MERPSGNRRNDRQPAVLVELSEQRVVPGRSGNSSLTTYADWERGTDSTKLGEIVAAPRKHLTKGIEREAVESARRRRRDAAKELRAWGGLPRGADLDGLEHIVAALTVPHLPEQIEAPAPEALVPAHGEALGSLDMRKRIAGGQPGAERACREDRLADGDIDIAAALGAKLALSVCAEHPQICRERERGDGCGILKRHQTDRQDHEADAETAAHRAPPAERRPSHPERFRRLAAATIQVSRRILYEDAALV